MSQGHLNLVIVGHVDHGKSTLVGRMLADLEVLPEGRLQQIKDYCANNAKPFEYAFILDALKEERRQGITIDVSRIFFRSRHRSYMILDAPGHEEFLKNMITGAAHADLSILLLDAKEGFRENTQRHILMLSLLGIKHLIVVINKMDLVDYSQETFLELKEKLQQRLLAQGLKADQIIPASAYEGENLTHHSGKMPWYKGETLFHSIEALNVNSNLEQQPLRFQVQDVYKFTENRDIRRIVAGPVLSGSLKVGEELLFSPSQQRGTVQSIESFPAVSIQQISAPTQLGITLKQELFIRRGEMATLPGDKGIQQGRWVRVRLFWLSKIPLHLGERIGFKVNSQKTEAHVVAIHHAIDSSCLDEKANASTVESLNVAECTLELKDSVVFDKEGSGITTNRFVFVKDFQIVGGGKLLQVTDPLVDPLDRQKLGNLLLGPREETQLNTETKELSLWYFKGSELEELRSIEKDLKARMVKVASLDFTNPQVSSETQNCLIKTLQALGYTLLILVSDESDCNN